MRALLSRFQRFTRMFVMIFQDAINSLDDCQKQRALSEQKGDRTRLRIMLLPRM